MTVTEVVITGVIGRWFSRRKWGAVTLPTVTGNIKIRYWVVKDPSVAKHEWSLHVPQIKELGGFGYLYHYARLWLDGFWIAWRVLGQSIKRSARIAYATHAMERDDWRCSL